jgi:hypothetical protein
MSSIVNHFVGSLLMEQSFCDTGVVFFTATSCELQPDILFLAIQGVVDIHVARA